MLSNQWALMDSYGISSILRQVYLWNGSLIVQPIAAQQKLEEDMK